MRRLYIPNSSTVLLVLYLISYHDRWSPNDQLLTVHWQISWLPAPRAQSYASILIQWSSDLCAVRRPSPGQGEIYTSKGDFATYFSFQYAHSHSLCVAYAHTILFVDCHKRIIKSPWVQFYLSLACVESTECRALRPIRFFMLYIHCKKLFLAWIKDITYYFDGLKTI